jgi:hypothetical protein
MRKTRWMMLAGGLVLSAAPAHAQTYDPSYPVCLKVYSGSNGGGGEYNDCTYMSLAQCAPSASGRPAICMVNPFYAYARSSGGPYRRHRHAAPQ